jgi:riboflavin kinase / FMN adenylyltransferase
MPDLMQSRKPMDVIHGFEHVPLALRGAALAIGNFDGVHRGHQALLAAVTHASTGTKGRPAGALAGVMIFEPHPRTLFQPDRPHFQLTPVPQKLALLRRYGMELTVIVPFNAALAALSAEAFVERVLVAGLGVSHVVVGYDFHYGKSRAGTPESLKQAGRSYNFGVTVVDQIADAGEIVSSSAIRTELAQGDVFGAAKMLGHWWRVAGTVRGGAKRGTGMGYPTANTPLLPGTALAHGIYAVRVYIDGERHHGAAYLGTRPTFDDGAAVLETFLFDFDQDLYGREIEIEFIAMIRGDRKFDGMDALVEQMAIDCDRARVKLRAADANDPFALPGGA